MRLVLALSATALLSACASDAVEIERAAVQAQPQPEPNYVRVGPQGPLMTEEQLRAERMRRLNERRANGFE